MPGLNHLNHLKNRFLKIGSDFFYNCAGMKNFSRGSIRLIRVMLCLVFISFFALVVSMVFDKYSHVWLGLFIFLFFTVLIVASYRLFRSNIARYLLFLILFTGGLIVYDNKDFASNRHCNYDVSTMPLGGGKTSGEQQKNSTQKHDTSIQYSTQNLIPPISNVNNSLAAFFPSRGDYDYFANFWYVLLHFAMYVAVGILMMSLFGRKLANGLSNFTASDCNKYVFWGKQIGNSGMLLAKDIYAKTKQEQMLFIVSSHEIHNSDDEKEIYAKMEQENLLLHILDFEPLFDKDKSRSHKMYVDAPKHFFLSDDQHWNVKMAQCLISNLPELPGDAIPLIDVYIKIGDGEICELFSKWADKMRKHANVHLINEAALTAEIFTLQHSMLECPNLEIDFDKAEVRGEFRLLLLGFGWLGRQLLINSVCSAQVAEGTPFHADVIDFKKDHYEPLIAACDCAPPFKSAIVEYDLNFYNYNVRSIDFHHFIKNNLKLYNRLIVCLGDDELNIDTSYLLMTLGKEQHTDLRGILYTHVMNPMVYDYLQQVNSEIFFCYGAEIANKQTIVDQENAALAMLLNWEYSNNFYVDKINETAVKKLWGKASLFNQASSRASAVGQFTLLRLLGYTVAEADSRWTEIPHGLLHKPDADDGIWSVLARAEHLRWNAWHFLQGIHVWKPDSSQVDFFPEKWSANQIDLCNCHAALVPFDELPSVDRQIENLKNGKTAKTQENDCAISKSQKFDFLFAHAVFQNMNLLGKPLIRWHRWTALKYYIRETFAHSKFRPILTYHNIFHAEYVAAAADELVSSLSGKISYSERDILSASAYCHDLGYVVSAVDHEKHSVELAEKELSNWGFSKEEIGKITNLIMETCYPYHPVTPLGKLLCDADMAHIADEDYKSLSDKLRAECIGLGQGEKKSDLKNAEDDLAFLEKTEFITDAAKKLYNPGREKNILALKQKVLELKQM